MSLAQERAFQPKSVFKKKMAWDIPTRNYPAAERATVSLRERFKKASKTEKKEMLDLMFEATRTLTIMTNNKRKYSKKERTEFFRMALLYSRLKSEFAGSVGKK